MSRVTAVLILAMVAGAVSALDSSHAGTYAAVDQRGQFLEKILRVTRTDTDWKFEDRQPDGSWLDVSCHGGCEHKTSTPAQVREFFNEAPPPGLSIDCVGNEQYAFCHGAKMAQDGPADLFALIVRIENDWLPVAMVRMPDENSPPGQETEPGLDSA